MSGSSVEIENGRNVHAHEMKIYCTVVIQQCFAAIYSVKCGHTINVILRKA